MQFDLALKICELAERIIKKEGQFSCIDYDKLVDNSDLNYIDEYSIKYKVSRESVLNSIVMVNKFAIESCLSMHEKGIFFDDIYPTQSNIYDNFFRFKTEKRLKEFTPISIDFSKLQLKKLIVKDKIIKTMDIYLHEAHFDNKLSNKTNIIFNIDCNKNTSLSILFVLGTMKNSIDIKICSMSQHFSIPLGCFFASTTESFYKSYEEIDQIVNRLIDLVKILLPHIEGIIE